MKTPMRLAPRCQGLQNLAEVVRGGDSKIQSHEVVYFPYVDGAVKQHLSQVTVQESSSALK